METVHIGRYEKTDIFISVTTIMGFQVGDTWQAPGDTLTHNGIEGCNLLHIQIFFYRLITVLMNTKTTNEYLLLSLYPPQILPCTTRNLLWQTITLSDDQTKGMAAHTEL